MRIVPFLLALGLAVGGVVVPAATVPGESMPGESVPVDDGEVSITAAPTFAGVLRPGQALQVTGAVTNSAGQTMDAGTATVYLSLTPVSNRAAMNAWLDPEGDSADVQLGAELGSTVIGELAPGQLRSFTITIPAPSLGLDSHAFAALPLSVRLATDGIELDLTRSALVWSPSTSGPTTNLAIAMPIVTPPGTTGLLSAEELTTYTAPGGLLTTQLDTAFAHPVAIGIDPMILASIRILGTSAPQSALDWLSRLAMMQNDIFALSYADSDLPAVRQAGAQLPFGPLAFPINPSLFAPVTDETPAPTETPAPEPLPPLPTPESLLEWAYSIDGLAWPAEHSVVEKDLDVFDAIGFTRTILNSAAVSGNSAATPNVMLGTHPATISDETISGFLRAAATAATELDWQSAMASLAAELAVSASGHSGNTVFATLDRDGSATGQRLQATLDALGALPWVAPTTLQDAISTPATSAKLVAAAEPGTRVSTVGGLLDSEAEVGAFSSVLNDPTLLTGPRRLALLAILAQAWHADQAGWNAAATSYLSDNDVLVNAVHIPDSSTITLLQEKSNLPIAVTNELDFPVTVYVTVQPERAILDIVDSRVELIIEANSMAKASVPVQSIANGEVRTKVTLTSATNVAISEPTFVELNVQAGWETAATVVLAVVVVGLFGAGIGRTIIRRRKLRKVPLDRATAKDPA